MDSEVICVIGAGKAGSAVAGDMALVGHQCHLFEFPEYVGNIEPIREQGGIRVTGIAHTGFAKIELASTDLAKTVTFPDCCQRLKGPRTVNIHRVDGPNMLLAALPATDTSAVLQTLEGTYTDMAKPAMSVLVPTLPGGNEECIRIGQGPYLHPMKGSENGLC